MLATQPSYSAFRSVHSFASIDGLRCLSILAVIYHHSQGTLTFGRISTRGFLGVDLFFVISGFLIVTLLLREKERAGNIHLRLFFVRRALRIFPLYYGIILLCTFLFGFVRTEGNQSRAFFHELPYLLTYTTNWFSITTFLAVSWSLSAEEQFYLIWPPIQKYVKHTITVLLFLVTLSQAIHLGFLDGPLYRWFGWTHEQPTMLRETTFTPILLGVLLAHLLHREDSFKYIAHLLGGRATPLVLLALLGLSLMVMPLDIRGWPRLSLHIIMMALLASCVVREDHWLARLCTFGPVARVGMLSYGLYLWHMFALDTALRLVERRYIDPQLTFPTTLLGSLIIAEIGYRMFESRFLRMKDRFKK